MQFANIQHDSLKSALDATTEKRGSKEIIKNYHEIMDVVKESEVMQNQWENYQKDFEYAMGITLEDICDMIVGLMDELV